MEHTEENNEKCRFCGDTPSYKEFYINMDCNTEENGRIKCEPTCISCAKEKLLTGELICEEESQENECRFCNKAGTTELTISDDLGYDDDSGSFVLSRPICIPCAIKCLFKGLPLL